ncbi:hypothetical protein [Legionella quateirensis]|uniref:Uncharacterized protein n=1 Tax=Legionella quateirensis TaxID=45072 RepID=A0A378KXM3_9GAMM|nr:hypothetical protein [Legionella quateirensis]KTD48319.1 hypothetical protein Lqua_1848 [Legionella quateirensis]STY18351.1 Uncharacterised protein [Legionella quateirensis]
MKKISEYLWTIITGIATIWGFLSFIWIILSYFNIFPFYEIKIKKINSVELITNLFSGQDIQLDFNPIGYVDRSEIHTAQWDIKHEKQTLFTLTGLRPILSLPKTADGIFNISVKLTLENHGILQGYSNIYVVQQATHQITTQLLKNIIIKSDVPQNSMAFNGTGNPLINTSEIEVYAGNNMWLKKKIIKSGNNYYINLNPGDHVTTTANKMILRIPHSESTASYLSVPFNESN